MAESIQNNCTERSPFEEIEEFYTRCPQNVQAVPSPNALLQDLSEKDVQFKFEQNHLLDVFNAAVSRQDSRFQAGVAILNESDYDGTYFLVQVEWQTWCTEKFNLSNSYRITIEREQALYLWREGNQKSVFVTLKLSENGKLQAEPQIVGLNQVFALETIPEPPKPMPPPVVAQEVPPQNSASQVDQMPEQEYTCPYDNEVNSVTSQSQTCAIISGLTADTMAIAGIKGHAESLINKISSMEESPAKTACQGNIGRLQLLISLCDNGLEAWQRDMDSLDKSICKLMNLQLPEEERSTCE